MDILPRSLSEAAGLWLGYAIGPLFGAGSALRRARVFHPGGIVMQATIKPHANVNPLYFDVAKNLSGQALMRFSSSIWKKESRLPDALGCAIRFRIDNSTPLEGGEPMQDLILVTSPHLVTLPLHILVTQQHDFLANAYHAITPYWLGDQENVTFRMLSLGAHVAGKNRNEKLVNAAEQKVAGLQLEIKLAGQGKEWSPLLEIQLTGSLAVDQRLLDFSPFHADLGIRPQGFVNYIRYGTYVFSQFARMPFTMMAGSQVDRSQMLLPREVKPEKQVRAKRSQGVVSGE